MRLKSIGYSQYQGSEREWRIQDFELGNINLVAGKNASGKSRLLNVIANLANLVCGDTKPEFKTGSYHAAFDDNDKKIDFYLDYWDSNVTKEEMLVDNVPVLTRRPGGKGQIFYEEMQKLVDFHTPPKALASVVRRDDIQHKFLEPLYQWGKLCRHFRFGTELGKGSLAAGDKRGFKLTSTEVNAKMAELVIPIYKTGEAKFKKEFQPAVIRDMAKIGYQLTAVKVAEVASLLVSSPPGSKAYALTVKEQGITHTIDQHEMSPALSGTRRCQSGV